MAASGARPIVPSRRPFAVEPVLVELQPVGQDVAQSTDEGPPRARARYPRPSFSDILSGSRHSAGMNWSAAILAGGRARRLGGQDKSAPHRRWLPVHRSTARCLAATDRSDRARRLSRRASRVNSRGARWMARCRPAGRHWPRALVTARDRPSARTRRATCRMSPTPFLAFLADVDPDAAAVVPVCDGRWQPLCAIYARSAADTFVTASRARRSSRGPCRRAASSVRG